MHLFVEKGIKGEVGPEGRRGFPGMKGISGPKGEVGAPGLSNATVTPGPVGDKGDRGPPGAPGRNGRFFVWNEFGHLLAIRIFSEVQYFPLVWIQRCEYEQGLLQHMECLKRLVQKLMIFCFENVNFRWGF